MYLTGFFFRRAYKGPYVPIGGGRSRLGSYNRNQFNMFGDRKSRERGSLLSNPDGIDVAEALWNNAQERAIFDQLVEQIFESLPTIADLNPGQQAILEEYIGDGVASVKRQGRKINPENIVSDARSGLGDEKYNAVSQTIENAAVLIEEAANEIFNSGEWWAIAASRLDPFLNADVAFRLQIRAAIAGAKSEVVQLRYWDSVFKRNDAKSFTAAMRLSPFNNFPTPNRVFGTNAIALQAYRANASINFKKEFPDLARRGIAWDSYEGTKARQRKTVTNFFETRGYTKQANGNYLTKTDLAKIQTTRNQVTHFGKRW